MAEKLGRVRGTVAVFVAGIVLVVCALAVGATLIAASAVSASLGGHRRHGGRRSPGGHRRHGPVTECDQHDAPDTQPDAVEPVTVTATW